MARLLSILLLTGVAVLSAASMSRTAVITVVIRPEATLEVQGSASAVVMIRLRQGTQAVFAIQDACTGAPEDGVQIERSGTYTFPLEKEGRFACLYTAERTLSAPAQPR